MSTLSNLTPCTVRPSPLPGHPALWEPVTRTLILADLHYGHEVELLRGGVWVPSRAAERTWRDRNP